MSDHSVAPRLTQRDEPRGYPEVETDSDYRAEVAPLRRDRSTKVGVVIELRDSGDPDPIPDPDQRADQHRWP